MSGPDEVWIDEAFFLTEQDIADLNEFAQHFCPTCMGSGRCINCVPRPGFWSTSNADIAPDETARWPDGHPRPVPPSGALTTTDSLLARYRATEEVRRIIDAARPRADRPQPAAPGTRARDTDSGTIRRWTGTRWAAAPGTEGSP